MSLSLTLRELARLIELTLRKADATLAEVEQLCHDARQHGFGSVCVNGSRLVQAVHLLEGTEVEVTCAVAFPLGASEADAKRYETEAAIDSGAHRIEVVANLGWLKDGDHPYVLRELRDVVEAADERPVSVLLDASLLGRDEIHLASRLVLESGAKGITTTGGSRRGTAIDIVCLIRQVVGENLGLKVDQENFTVVEVPALIEAGVTRFGMARGAPLLESLQGPPCGPASTG